MARRPSAAPSRSTPSQRTRPSTVRVFFTTALLTSCLLLLGIGFLVADYNTRQMGFGDGSLRVDVTAKDNEVFVNLFGREQAYRISESVAVWSSRLWTLLPPGLRSSLWLLEGECQAVPSLWEWLDSD